MSHCDWRKKKHQTLMTAPFIITFCLSGATPDRANNWALNNSGDSSVLHSTSLNFSFPHLIFTKRNLQKNENIYDHVGKSQLAVADPEFSGGWECGNLKGGVTTYYLLNFFVENWMKTKKLDWGRTSLASPRIRQWPNDEVDLDIVLQM